MNEKNEIVAGLIKGRHPMPVSDYIFDREIEDVFDFYGIGDVICGFLLEKVGIVHKPGQGINQYSEGDVTEIYSGEKRLVVYVTGLTAVTAELIRLCAINGIRLTLMHYDARSGNYVPQGIF